MVLSIKTSKCLLLLCDKFSHACMKNIFQSSSDQRVCYEREIMKLQNGVFSVCCYQGLQVWVILVNSYSFRLRQEKEYEGRKKSRISAFVGYTNSQKPQNIWKFYTLPEYVSSIFYNDNPRKLSARVLHFASPCFLCLNSSISGSSLICWSHSTKSDKA